MSLLDMSGDFLLLIFHSEFFFLSYYIIVEFFYRKELRVLLYQTCKNKIEEERK